MFSNRAKKGFAASVILVVALSAVGASSAVASHFRSSSPSFSITGNTATWTIVSAWETNDVDSFVGVGGTAEIDELTALSDPVDSGSYTGVDLTGISETQTEEGLYSQNVEVMQGDLSSLGDGIYEIYVNSCCRVDDVQNALSSDDDFSQWVRFTKTAGVYAVAPVLSGTQVYVALSLDGSTTVVTVPSPTATAWYPVTDIGAPYFGAEAMPCSTFVDDQLEIGSEHCTGGDVYADIYLTGTFWAFKTLLVDAAGLESVAEVLFRVESTPEPYIDRHVWLSGGTSADFSAFAADTVVDSFEVTCTNTADGSDVVSATGTSVPIRVMGFTSGDEYDCVVDATNGAGTGSSSSGDYVITYVAPELTLDLLFVVGDVFNGQTVEFSGVGIDNDSDFDLTMYSDPVVFYSDSVSFDGSFSGDTSVPDEACIAGQHEIRLSAQAGGQPISTSQYLELDASCVVLTIQSTPFELAETGPADSGALGGLALAALGAGIMLVVASRRSRHMV
ncbi:MAG: hypothetical protein RLZZ608_72 [Actinomycetota bacterium]